jgi:2-polyprenyl-3-methyl-5-hydroxy-6-metoxy-1,4-benzoquinol methylase
MYSRNTCYFCSRGLSKSLFGEKSGGKEYKSYYCVNCDVFQTLGELEAISPDYVDLEQGDLDEAHVYLQRNHKHNAFRQLFQRLEAVSNKKFEKNDLLDIGCGVGGFLDYLQLNSPQVNRFGFDASAAQVEIAKQLHPNVKLAMDAKKYSSELGGKRFDVATMWDVFEHIRDPNSFLRSISSVIEPGGYLVISVPCGAVNPVKVASKRLLGRKLGLIPWEHVFYYTKNSLRMVLSEAGFQVAEIGYVYPYRRRMGLSEFVRVTAHHALGRTRYAFQIYAIARKPKDQDL